MEGSGPPLGHVRGDDFEDVSWEEAAAIIPRLVHGVAVGSVTVGVRDRVAVATDQPEQVESASAEAAADEGGDADAAPVKDAPVEAPTEEALTGEESPGAGRQDPEDAPDSTSVVEPGEVAESGSKARFERFEDSAGEWR